MLPHVYKLKAGQVPTHASTSSYHSPFTLQPLAHPPGHLATHVSTHWPTRQPIFLTISQPDHPLCHPTAHHPTHSPALQHTRQPTGGPSSRPPSQLATHQPALSASHTSNHPPPTHQTTLEKHRFGQSLSQFAV
ncbi:hypothetical protein Pmani_036163 [Petrolisthes manimaculis]|uniref:Uncharacterized protein n=1 Tax=Petrolisthes manimaculis TaxID=1843537 RepID=A0AAE1NKR3_9EUCA|nr:hypothetical protein Pmani_036163 [Petrolisthes manimaculis]